MFSGCRDGISAGCKSIRHITTFVKFFTCILLQLGLQHCEKLGKRGGRDVQGFQHLERGGGGMLRIPLSQNFIVDFNSTEHWSELLPLPSCKHALGFHDFCSISVHWKYCTDTTESETTCNSGKHHINKTRTNYSGFSFWLPLG